MGNSRQTLGRWGEKLAATHLEANGYTIEIRNWRCPYGEIDLIARLGETIHVVEVKTRRGRPFGPPEMAISAQKYARLVQCALTYLSEYYDTEPNWQIDLVAVELDTANRLLRCEQIQHIASPR